MSVLSLAAVSAVLAQLDTLRTTLQGVADQITADDNAAPPPPVLNPPVGGGALTDDQIESVALDAAAAVRADLRGMAGKAPAEPAPALAPFPPPLDPAPVVVTADPVPVVTDPAPVTDNPGAVPGTSGVGDVIPVDPTANVG